MWMNLGLVLGRMRSMVAKMRVPSSSQAWEVAISARIASTIYARSALNTTPLLENNTIFT